VLAARRRRYLRVDFDVRERDLLRRQLADEAHRSGRGHGHTQTDAAQAPPPPQPPPRLSTGMAYLTRWRMQVAAAAIADGQTTIVELANRLGYRAEAAFARAFKRVIGAPPGAVRATRAQAPPRPVTPGARTTSARGTLPNRNALEHRHSHGGTYKRALEPGSGARTRAKRPPRGGAPSVGVGGVSRRPRQLCPSSRCDRNRRRRRLTFDIASQHASGGVIRPRPSRDRARPRGRSRVLR
jgi:AraC-like DNA-binding protein